MTTYAAFLRGIMPTNPNMRNEKLRGVFESLGFSDVKTVISSGNVIFKSEIKNYQKLEETIEKALTKQLGINSGVFIRSLEDLKNLIKRDPFKGKNHTRTTYLLVTFLKKKPCELFTVINLENAKTPDFMKILDKEHGKENTSRTWKTVQRMVEKMEN
jgi:uncharacterized protein (DUF1697 family)